MTDRKEEAIRPLSQGSQYAAMENACPTCHSLDGWRIPHADLDANPQNARTES
jgi:hypothetical protein